MQDVLLECVICRSFTVTENTVIFNVFGNYWVHSILRKFTDKCTGKDDTWKDKAVEGYLSSML